MTKKLSYHASRTCKQRERSKSFASKSIFLKYEDNIACQLIYQWFETNYCYFLRQTESQKPKSSEQTSSGQSPCSLILRAEPTVASILKVKNTTVFKNGFKSEIKIKCIWATSCKSGCSNYVSLLLNSDCVQHCALLYFRPWTQTTVKTRRRCWEFCTICCPVKVLSWSLLLQLQLANFKALS